MRDKIEKLLEEKKREQNKLISDWNGEECPNRFMENSYAEECNKLEAEIELLKHLLKL